MIKYKCPYCRATCNTSHCFDCDKDIPMSERFDDNSDYANSYSVIKSGSDYKFDYNVGEYFFSNSENRVFRVMGQSDVCSYDDLVSFELVENKTSTRDINMMYIMIVTRSVGALKIVLINYKTELDGMFYRAARGYADKIIAQLHVISASKNIENTSTEKNDDDLNDKKPVFSVADELLKLKQLMDMGVLTQEEFDKQKQKLLNA